MTNIISYVDVIELLQSIASRHKQINTFFLGKNWNLGESESITYPCLQAYPEVASLPINSYGEYKTIEIRLVCKVIDLVRQNKSNELDVDSDTLRIAQDIINEFNQHPFYQRSNANLVGDINLSNISEFNSDGTSGWEFSITLKLVNNNSYCGLPIEDITGYSAAGPVYTGYTTDVQYLTCSSVTGCTVLTDYIQQIVDAHTGLTYTVADTQVAFGSGTTIVSSSGLTFTRNGSETFFNLIGDTGDVKYTITNTKTNGGYAEIKLATDISDTRFGAGGTNTTPYGGPAGSSYFGNVSANGLILATSNTPRAYFKGTGELGLGTNFLTPQRQFHQYGGKFLVESTDGSYGQFQIVNPNDSEVTLVLGANATVNPGGTLSAIGATGDSKIWAFGLGSYSWPSDQFIIGNNYLGGPAIRINYDGKTFISANTTSVADVIVGTNKVIKSNNGGGELSLDAYGSENSVMLSIDNSAYDQGQLYMTNSPFAGGYVELSTYSNNAGVYVGTNNFGMVIGEDHPFRGNRIAVFGNSKQLIINDDLANAETEGIYLGYNANDGTTGGLIIKNNFSGPRTTAHFDSSIAFLNASGAYADANVANSVVLGGTDLSATTSNTVYVPYLNIKNPFTGSTAVAGLAIDANGNVVTGNTSTGGATVTGGTYSNGTATFNNSTGGTFQVTGFYTGATTAYVTGFTYNNSNQFTISNGTGGTFNATINTVTGLTVNGGLTSNTISIVPVTGGTANSAQTVNVLLSDQFTYTLSANTTFTFTNNANGKSWVMAVSSNATTPSLTASFAATGATIKWPYSITPVMSTATGKTDIYSFTQINGVVYGDYAQQY